jgi:hypothetical protein
VLGTLIGGFVLLVVIITAVLLILGHLDAGPIKQRVQAAAHQNGIDLDYGKGSLSLFSGLLLQDIRIQSAPEDRELAPNLATIREVQIRWSLGDLLGKTVADIGIHDIALTVLQNEAGETSLDRFLAYRAKLSPPGPPPPPGPITPVSKLVASYLPASVVTVSNITVDGVSARLIKTKDGKPAEQFRAGTLALGGHAAAGAGKLDLQLDLGTEPKPLALEVADEQLDASGAAVAGSTKVLTSHPWIQLKGDEKTLSLSFAVPVERRELAPSLPTGNVAEGRVLVRFDPAQSNTAITIEQFSLVDGAATATANVDLKDTDSGSARPLIRKAQVDANLDQLAARLHDLMPPGIDLKGGTLKLTAAEVGMPATGVLAWLPGAPVMIGEGGSLDLDVALDSFDMRSDTSQTHVRKTHVTVHGQPGLVEVGTEVQKVALGDFARPETEVEGLGLKASVKPQSDGRLVILARAPIKHVALHGATQVDVRELELGVDGTLREFSRFDGQVTTSLQTTHYAAKGKDVLAKQLSLALKLDGAQYNSAEPAASSAGIALRVDLADATVRMAKKIIHAGGVAMNFDTSVKSGDVKNASLVLPVERLSVDSGVNDPHLTQSKLSMDVKVDSIALDKAHYDRSRAHVVADIELGALRFKADVDKQADSVQFDLNGGAERLGALAGLARGSVSEEDRKMLEQLGIDLQTKGSADHLSRTSDLAVNHKTRLVLRRPSAHREDLDFSAKEVTLQFDSHGTMRSHAFDLNVDLESPRLNRTGGEGHQTISLKGAFDMGRPHVDLHIAGSGVTGPEGKFDLAGGYDPTTNVVDWNVDGSLAKLGLVGVVMPPGLAKKHHVNWETFAIEAHGAGKHPSLVKKYKAGAPPSFVFVDDPLEAARGTTKLDLTVIGVDYHGEDETTLQLPSMALHVNSSILKGNSHSNASLDIPKIHAVASGHKLDASKLAPSFVLDTLGDRNKGEAKINVTFTAESIVQDAEPGYPIGDMDLRVKASADTGGAVRIERVAFDNKLGGTHLDFHGGMDFRPLDADGTSDANQVITRALASSSIPGRKNLLIDGRLTQKLDALHMDEKVFSGKGTIAVPFRLESGDLRYVHLESGLRFTGVDIQMPKSGLFAYGLQGKVALVQDVFVDEERHVTTLAGAAASAYRRTRFSDQQKFVESEPLTASKIRMDLSSDPLYPDFLELTNFNANVGIDRNLIAIDQMETDLIGGHMQGQLLVDYRGNDTEVVFHGGVTNLHTSQDPERLDANAAISLRPWKRLMEGRVEIVRLGRGHLTKILEWYDPYLTDSKANKARKAIAYGYPKSVRMRFHEGFASFALDLGGVAAAVRIDEITGVPVGPILERYLARRLRKKDEDQ